jgi:hypothetical protein
MSFFSTINKGVERYKAQQAQEAQDKIDYEKSVKQSLGLLPSSDIVSNATVTKTDETKPSNTKKYLLIGGSAVLLIVAIIVIIKKIKK